MSENNDLNIGKEENPTPVTETVSKVEYDRLQRELEQARFNLASKRIEEKKEKTSIEEIAEKIASQKLETFIIENELQSVPESDRLAVREMMNKLNVSDPKEKITLAKKLALNNPVAELEKKAIEKAEQVEKNTYSPNVSRPTSNPNNPQVDPKKEIILSTLRRQKSMGMKHLQNLTDEDLRKMAYR